MHAVHVQALHSIRCPFIHFVSPHQWPYYTTAANYFILKQFTHLPSQTDMNIWQYRKGSSERWRSVLFFRTRWISLLSVHNLTSLNFYHRNKLKNAETGGTSGPTRICTVFMHTPSRSIFRRAEISQWQEMLNWKLSEEARTGYSLYATYLQAQQGMGLVFVLSS